MALRGLRIDFPIMILEESGLSMKLGSYEPGPGGGWWREALDSRLELPKLKEKREFILNGIKIV